MFRKCHLVHADLSAFNMLWHNGKVHFIDVSQSVEPTHPHGFEFLLRDCTNVSTFFTKKGLPDVPSPQELFNDITQLNITADSKEEFLTLVSASLSMHSLLAQLLRAHMVQHAFLFYRPRHTRRSQPCSNT